VTGLLHAKVKQRQPISAAPNPAVVLTPVAAS
jgi:hypothetical protein